MELVPQRWKKKSIVSCRGHLHVEISSCNLEWFKNDPCNRFVKQNPVIPGEIAVSPKKVGDRLQRGDVTRCNPPAICLATPLQHKLQRKLHFVTLAVELGLTFCSDYRDFSNIASCNPRLQHVTCLLQFARDFFLSALRNKLKGKLHLVTLALKQSFSRCYRFVKTEALLYMQLTTFT